MRSKAVKAVTSMSHESEASEKEIPILAASNECNKRIKEGCPPRHFTGLYCLAYRVVLFLTGSIRSYPPRWGS